MMMLTSTVIRLRARQDATLPDAMGEYGHAAFLSLIREVAPELAIALHDSGGRRPYTVSPLYGGRKRERGNVEIVAGREYWMRFTIFDPQLYAVFGRYFAENASFDLDLVLGGARFGIEEVTTAPDQHRWGGYATFEGLLAEARDSRIVPLRFQSLTAFSLGREPDVGPRCEILPVPLLVFDSLLQRWNLCAPQPLAERRAWREWVAEHVVVRQYQLKSEMWRFRKHVQIGFVGDCSFEARGKSVDEVRQLNALAAFAFYAGVGMKTTMGMGQCRLIPSGEAARVPQAYACRRRARAASGKAPAAGPRRARYSEQGL